MKMIKMPKLAVALTIALACSVAGTAVLAQSPPPPPPEAHGQGEAGAAHKPPKKPRDKRPPRGGEAEGAPVNTKPAPADGGQTPRGDEVSESDSVVISGGFETDPRDKGRPVILIASALGVPAEVFREAFSGVTPAGTNSGGPTAEQAQSNKAALMKVLGPYGITNERLDEVSNYYRYNGSKGEVWSRRLAQATAVVTDGVVTGVTITDPGAGYTSPPAITVKGPDGKTISGKAEIVYTTDFRTNGSIASITIQE